MNLKKNQPGIEAICKRKNKREHQNFYLCRYGSEEVVHARNVIAFFVWAWPSD